MFRFILVFLAIVIIAAIIAFGGLVVGIIAVIAKFVFYIFLVLLLIAGVMHLFRGS